MPVAQKRTWLIVAIVAGVVVVGGGVAAAIALTRRGDDSPPPPPPPAQEAGAPEAAPPAIDACAPTLGRPCGKCEGTVLCDGRCSRPTPERHDAVCGPCNQGRIDCNNACTPPPRADLGKSCNACSGRIQCNGACSPAAPVNFGKSCGCAGTFNCNGACTRPAPADLGQIKVAAQTNVMAAMGNPVRFVGGPCQSGHVFQDVLVKDGLGPCPVVQRPSGASCRVGVRPTMMGLIPGSCLVTVRQRRVCD